MSTLPPVSSSSTCGITTRSVVAGSLLLVGLVVGVPSARAARCTDTSGFAAAAAAVNAAVSCAGAVRHRKYVKDAKRALRSTGLRGACRKGFLDRFIKRSLCGRRPGRFEVCCRANARGKDISKVVKAGRCRKGQACSGAPQSVGAGCTDAGTCVTTTSTTTSTTTTTTTPVVCAPLTPVLGPGQFGSLLDAAEFANAPQALPVEALRSTPAGLPAVVVLGNVPAVTQQGTESNPGSPGSCEAQAFGYGLGSYTAARRPDGSIRWDPAAPEHSLSAAFLYGLIQRQQRDADDACYGGQCTCPSGSLATPYLARLVAFGGPSRAEVPYQADCCYLDAIDLDRSYPEATRFRIGSFATFDIMNQADVVERIKQYLWNGQVVAFSGLVPEAYGVAPTFVDGVLYEQNTIPDSGHGQIIVGYDDRVGRPDLGLGAFLVQNSFGTGWPPKGSGSIAPPGLAYWSYETFVKTQMFAAVAYPVDPERPTVPPLASDAPDAPEAFVTDASQWARASSSADVYLILQHHFAAPVVLERVALQGPTASSAEFSAPYANYIADGYTYFRRTDGQQFESGQYAVTLHAVTLDGTRVAYTGTISIGGAAPGMPPTAPVTADTMIFGTTGQAATIAIPFGPG
jgi:hypothetical protein